MTCTGVPGAIRALTCSPERGWQPVAAAFGEEAVPLAPDVFLGALRGVGEVYETHASHPKA
ncbi:MAG: hypothetical protein OXC93_16570 [Rhodospirillaceae bacterium]|nr:hypothetical protein [Rhodospirillaceae bacterium]